MRHLGKFYYKDYFKVDSEGNKIDFNILLNKNDKTISENNNKVILRNNEELINAELEVIPNIGSHSFEAKVAYPGLITGVGINHEASIEGEFKLGVHFDPTYGMPVIYGSSVKGVLRSAFKDGYFDSNEKFGVKTDSFIKDVFEGVKDYNKDSECQYKSIYDRDIFFDAVITKPNSKGRILESDALAPHNENPLRNPVPIIFVKIASGCTIEFRFKLVDSIIHGVKITKEDKLKLFKEIILTLGVGAKTNVGYGQFEQ